MRHDSRVFKIGSGIFIEPTICYATPDPLGLNCMEGVTAPDFSTEAAPATAVKLPTEGCLGNAAARQEVFPISFDCWRRIVIGHRLPTE
jgi:hypothetical protein